MRKRAKGDVYKLRMHKHKGRERGILCKLFGLYFTTRMGEGGGQKYRKYENVIYVRPRTLQKLEVAAKLRKGGRKSACTMCVSLICKACSPAPNQEVANRSVWIVCYSELGLPIGCVPPEKVATKLALLEALYTRSILLNGIHYSNAKSRD